MSAFEFSLIPIAIVIGFAITQLLSLWASLIRNWQAVSQPAFYVSISLWLLVALLVHFTGLWAYREVSFGSFGTLLLVISPTLFFMLSISVLVPDGGQLAGNLSDYYFERSRSVLGLAALAAALSGVPDFLPGVISSPGPWLLVWIIPLASLAFTNNRAAHSAGHVFIWIVVIVTQFIL